MNEAGLLSDIDVRKLLDKDIVICGYKGDNLTDIGYNLTPTEFIFSVNKGSLVKIYNEKNQKYCYIEANDTVLILTREAIWVSEKIVGTFHSKVKLVSNGFGHISTTLDANWEGPLLISLNNPTKKPIKLILAEDKGKGVKYNSFVTLIFYKMVTPTNNPHDNPPCRLDILREKIKSPKFLDWSNNNYWKLRNVIDKIRDFESLQVNIGQSKDYERIIKIEKFKKKYEDFTKNLEFQIEEAHEINRQILLKNQIFFIIKSFILTIPFLCFFILGIDSWKKDKTNTIALISIFVAMYIPFYSRYVLEKRGE